MPVIYENLQAELLAAIPEIQPQYADLQNQWAPDPIPNYIVIEDLFTPFVDKKIGIAGAENGAIVHRAFQLIESMARSQATETQNLVFVAFYDGRDRQFLDRWMPKSLPATRALVERFTEQSDGMKF
jgi:hypothetical protein